MKKYFVLSWVLVAFVLSCKEDDPDPSKGNAQLVVTGVNPVAGAEGTKVIITGTGFSPATGKNMVKFGGVSAVIDSATTTRLVTKVPEGAKTGKISVETDGKSAASNEQFTVSVSNGTQKSPFVLKTATPTGKDFRKLLAVNGKVFALFSDLGEADNQVFEYDPQSNDWKQKASVPVAGNYKPGYRWKGNIDFVYQKKIYVTDESRKLYVFDPVGNTWSNPKVSAFLNEVSAFTINDRVFLTQGDLWKEYLPGSDKVVDRGKLPAGLSALSGDLKFLAGMDKGYMLYENRSVSGVAYFHTRFQLFEFDPATNQWREKTDWTKIQGVRPNSYNRFYGADIVGKSLYIYANGETQQSNDLLVMDLAAGSWKSVKCKSGTPETDVFLGRFAGIEGKGYFISNVSSKYQFFEFSP